MNRKLSIGTALGAFVLWLALGPTVTVAAPPVSPPTVTAAPTAAATITFVNPYDQTTQPARMQIPSRYSGAATPLLVVVHPRSADMFWGESRGYPEATEQQGWFYVAPQLHGSWPGTTAAPVPEPPGKFTYAALESQYDIVGSIQYMVEHYNIDPNRIYIYGQSMGAQTAAMTTARFPQLFAAAFFNKGPSDWTQWYEQTKTLIANGYSQTFHKQWMERECFVMLDGVPTPQTPSQNPFCYARRSSLNFAENFLHVPVAITHSSADRLVPISQSTQLRDAINRAGPDRAAELTIDTVVGPTCTDGAGEPTPYYHCYENDPAQVIAFLRQFTRNERPTTVRVKTDASNTFYWLTVALTGGEHWSSLTANVDLNNATVTAHVTDPNPPILGFNLGAAPITTILPQPGLGLPATTYLVQEAGQSAYLVDYSSGYLTTALHTTGEVDVSISAVEVLVTAAPPVKITSTPTTVTVTVTAKDRLNHPVPDQTLVTLTTSAGRFPNGGQSFSGGTQNGALQTTLDLTAADGAAQVRAAIGASPSGATGATTIAVLSSPTPGAISSPAPTPTGTATPVPVTTVTPISSDQPEQVFLPLIQR